MVSLPVVAAEDVSTVVLVVVSIGGSSLITILVRCFIRVHAPVVVLACVYSHAALAPCTKGGQGGKRGSKEGRPTPRRTLHCNRRLGTRAARQRRLSWLSAQCCCCYQRCTGGSSWPSCTAHQNQLGGSRGMTVRWACCWEGSRHSGPNRKLVRCKPTQACRR